MARFREARIGLNIRNRWNNGFFCPISRLHLTRELPYKVTYMVTPAILKGLRATGRGGEPKLIDIDNRIDLETGKFKEIPEPKEVVEAQAPPEDEEFVISGPVIDMTVKEDVDEKVEEDVPAEEVAEASEDVPVEEIKEEPKKTRKSSKKQK
jgi:hypothetical protein